MELGCSEIPWRLDLVVQKLRMHSIFYSAAESKHRVELRTYKYIFFLHYLQSDAGPQAEFKIKLQPDRSIVLESVKSSSQMVTISKAGVPISTKGKLASTKKFHCYVKVGLRGSQIVLPSGCYLWSRGYF